MFNPNDNYHWTEDLCTDKGVSIIKEYLMKKNINIEILNASIYRAQRMGKKKIRFDISAILIKDQKTYSILDYTSVSSADDISDSPVKSLFLEAVNVMRETLISTENVPATEKTVVSEVNIPLLKKSALAKTEVYKHTFTLRCPIDRAKEILFTMPLAQTWGFISGVTVSASNDNILSFTHPALSFKSVTEKKDSIHKNKYVFTSSAKLPEYAPFSFTITLSPLYPDNTNITLSSQEVPVNESVKITSLFSSLYLSPIFTCMHIAFS